MSPAKAALLAEIHRQGFREPDWRHKDPLPIVSIEQFFDGNDDTYSIAANLEPHPPLAVIRAALERIRSRADVADVLVEIYDIHDAEHVDESWPYSDKVYVISSAPGADAILWNQELQADGPVEGWAFSPPPVDVPEHHRVWQIIWD